MWSPSARFSTLALVAIVAPATIVAVLGWVSIRQWEASSELLYREQARDMATMAAEKVEMMLRHAEDAVLDRLQGALDADTPPARAVDDLLAHAPLVRRLYLIGQRGELLYPGAWKDGDAAIFGPLVAEAAKGKFERSGKREVVAGNQVCLAMLVRRGGEPVVAAFIRDPDTLRREIFETTLGALESSIIIAVLDHAGRTVYSRAPIGDAQHVLSVRFRETLPDWRLAVYQASGAAPRQAVRGSADATAGSRTEPVPPSIAFTSSRRSVVRSSALSGASTSSSTLSRARSARSSTRFPTRMFSTMCRRWSLASRRRSTYPSSSRSLSTDGT